MSRPPQEPVSELIRAVDARSADLWALPSFDPERPAEEVMPEPVSVEDGRVEVDPCWPLM